MCSDKSCKQKQPPLRLLAKRRLFCILQKELVVVGVAVSVLRTLVVLVLRTLVAVVLGILVVLVLRTLVVLVLGILVVIVLRILIVHASRSILRTIRYILCGMCGIPMDDIPSKQS